MAVHLSRQAIRRVGVLLMNGPRWPCFTAPLGAQRIFFALSQGCASFALHPNNNAPSWGPGPGLLSISPYGRRCSLFIFLPPSARSFLPKVDTESPALRMPTRGEKGEAGG